MRQRIGLQQVLKRLVDTYNSLDIRCLVARVHNQWLNLIIVLRFTASSVSEVERKHKLISRRLGSLDEDDVAIITAGIGKSEFNTFLKAFYEGKITIRAQEVNFIGEQKEDYFTGDVTMNWWINPFSAEDENYPMFHFTKRTFTITKISDEVRQLIDEKPATKFGYPDIPTLARGWLGISGLRRHSSYSTDVIVAFPIYARIGSINIQGNTINVDVVRHRRVKSLSVSTILSQIKPNSIDTIPKERKMSRLADRTDEGQDFTTEQISHEFVFIEPSDQVNVILTHDEFTEIIYDTTFNVKDILESKLYDTTPFIHALAKFIPPYEFEKQLLAPKEIRDAGVVFPKAVQRLLTIIGFQGVELEKHEHFRLKSGVTVAGLDLLFYDLKGWNLLAVNCSISPPEASELDKFKELLGRISTEMDSTHILRGLYFVASEAKLTKQQGEVVGIKIIDLQDLQEIWENTKRGQFDSARLAILK